MAADPEIIERLDRIQATLSIAFASQIAEYRDRIRADKVNAAILERQRSGLVRLSFRRRCPSSCR